MAAFRGEFSGSSQEWRWRSAADWVLALCQSSDPLFPPSPKCDRFFPNTAVWMCGPAYRRTRAAVVNRTFVCVAQVPARMRAAAELGLEEELKGSPVPRQNMLLS